MGSVLCDINSPIPLADRFRGQIVVFDIQRPLTIGVPVSILINFSLYNILFVYFTSFISIERE